MKWEYLCTDYYPSVAQEAKGSAHDKEGTDATAVQNWLNELGEEGWELVDVVFVEESKAFFREVLYYLRRPKTTS